MRILLAETTPGAGFCRVSALHTSPASDLEVKTVSSSANVDLTFNAFTAMMADYVAVCTRRRWCKPASALCRSGLGHRRSHRVAERACRAALGTEAAESPPAPAVTEEAAPAQRAARNSSQNRGPRTDRRAPLRPKIDQAQLAKGTKLEGTVVRCCRLADLSKLLTVSRRTCCHYILLVDSAYRKCCTHCC